MRVHTGRFIVCVGTHRLDNSLCFRLIVTHKLLSLLAQVARYIYLCEFVEEYFYSNTFAFFPLQICRNINRIKVCMETGQTVVLLNLENLYESLYDALNQVRLSDALNQVRLCDALNQV